MDGKALAASLSKGENKFHRHRHVRCAQQPKYCEVMSVFRKYWAYCQGMLKHSLTPKLTVDKLNGLSIRDKLGCAVVTTILGAVG